MSTVIAIEDFFASQIEPEWGHAHKGHVFFRLGMSYLNSDLAKAKAALDAAISDDLHLEKSRDPVAADDRARDYSAYVARTLLEVVDDSVFSTPAEMQQFWSHLVTSFDAVIHGARVRSDLVEDAINALAGPASATCTGLYRELRQLSARPMPVSTIAMTGAVLRRCSSLTYTESAASSSCNRARRYFAQNSGSFSKKPSG